MTDGTPRPETGLTGTQAPRMWTVPAGSEAARCNGPHCTATIYFVKNERTGKFLPIHCDVPGGRHPSEKIDPTQLDAFGAEHEEHDGLGISHFLDCPDAARFSGQSRHTA